MTDTAAYYTNEATQLICYLRSYFQQLLENIVTRKYFNILSAIYESMILLSKAKTYINIIILFIYFFFNYKDKPSASMPLGNIYIYIYY